MIGSFVPSCSLEGVANTYHKNEADWSHDGLGIRGAVRLFRFTVNYCRHFNKIELVPRLLKSV
jgi:hypothetical protein